MTQNDQDTLQGSFSLFYTLQHGSTKAVAGEGHPGTIHELECARVLDLLDGISLTNDGLRRTMLKRIEQ